MGTGKQAISLGALAALVALAGCSVHVNKNGNGEDKDVSIHTPFGGVQVHKNKGVAADLGLPAYPGAIFASDENDKSVDVRLGFGEWQLRVQAANYTTDDPQAKVQEFYRKAMARYGEVLVCQGNAAVGTPTRTAEGLTCADNGETKNVHVTRDANLELKAGSQHKQHIVAFDDKKHPGTHFALVALTLPPKGSSAGDDNEE